MDTDTTRLDAGHVPAATAEILDGLNDLLQLDHDAVGAYQIAMEKLQDRDNAAQIGGFLRDHERHIRELNELIADLGGTPKNQPHATGPFKLALQSLGGLAGDRGVLMAFRHNELQVRAKYDSYAAKANLWPTNIKRVVDGAALDEERHYRWVADAMKALGWGDGEGPELDAIDAARERAAVGAGTLNHAKELAGHAREAVVDATGQARERVADVAGQARDKAADVAEHARELSGQARERVVDAAAAVRNRISGMTGHGTERPGAYADAALGDGTYATYGTGTDRVAALRGRARDAGESFEHRYQERPLQTLAIAGIAGFVIGRLLR
ncbi:ferritin-like domain-containing protein [Longimicrobium terrae]|uniref:Rubrerythrin/uncharacterized protein YjbJ (UPF0337 family) n=1 Tax=Longimicrobium terrae TaxID=1639882 RepID=A0A841H1K5_9BACT|nr:uncharacterized protein YjbJ (UPF0337 family) [Longimicrobium terrae]MBB6071826.1 rubrerythrin/uncharacterized protein YjbJ (UPF0337 family) [Longimicrobium terrae]NNC30375.1 ferritin-like domain-containing protein [Longimicrobium terrae]